MIISTTNKYKLKQHIKVAFLLTLIICFWISACAENTTKDTSNIVKTVNIQQTPADIQGRVSNCWAYSLTAQIESNELEREGGGKVFNLSEEYLLFYYMIDTLQTFLDNYDSSGSNLPIEEKLTIEEGVDHLGGMKIAEKYGVVPEEVFGYKFRKAYEDAEGTEIDYIGHRSTEVFRELFNSSSQRNIYKNNQEALIQKLWDIWTEIDANLDPKVGTAGKPPAPDGTFQYTYDGKTSSVTPMTFMKHHMGFYPENYVFVHTVNNPSSTPTRSELNDSSKRYYFYDLEDSIKIIKRSLLARHTVNMAMHLIRAEKEKSDGSKEKIFKTSGRWDMDLCGESGVNCRDYQSLHGVVAVDFVTIDSQTGQPRPSGELTKEEIRTIFSNDETLDYFIVQDTRGDWRGLDQRGNTSSEGTDYYGSDEASLGFKKVKLNYLREILGANQHVNIKQNDDKGHPTIKLGFLLPRSILLTNYVEILSGEFKSRYGQTFWNFNFAGRSLSRTDEVSARIVLNKPFGSLYQKGEQIGVSASIGLHNKTVDVYMMLLTPDDKVISLQKTSDTTAGKVSDSNIAPLETGFTGEYIVSSPNIVNETLPNADPAGQYAWYIVLTNPGADVTQKSNWKAYDKVIYYLETTTSSNANSSSSPSSTSSNTNTSVTNSDTTNDSNSPSSSDTSNNNAN